MRTQNTIKNIYISIVTQIVIILLGFLSRKVFLDSLGTEYLGINGLLTNILSLLSLVEGGIGTSITYNLYKPLSDNDTPRIIALVQLYKKLYTSLAIVIFILSVILYMFIGSFIKESTTVEYVGIVYFIFVIKNMISYLNAHKWSLINADQKGYIINKYNIIFNIMTTISKILILKTTNNYILYLVVEIVIYIYQNLYNRKVIDLKYPYIVNIKQKYSIDIDTKQNLITNVKAIFLHNIGSYCVFGTDNLLISVFVNIKTVGLYSNYTMITNQLNLILNEVFSGIGASVGNLIATENNEKIKSIFNVTYMINFWFYSISVIFLYNLLEPFISWWLGKGLLLDRLSFIFILINFYITGMRTSVKTFKSKAGIFSDDKYISLMESILNLGASLVLANYLGLAGIFIGTTISTICFPLWIQPKLVYDKVFNTSSLEYFKKYLFYLLLTTISGAIATYTCNHLINTNGFISLVARGSICIIIPSIIYTVIFYKTEEFNHLLNMFRTMISKFYKYKHLAKE